MRREYLLSKEIPVLAAALLIVVSGTQTSTSATVPTPQQLAERFVNVAMSEPISGTDGIDDTIAEELIKSNPGRAAQVKRIVREMSRCMEQDGNAAMRRAAIEAALAFDSQQLERLIAFAKMQAAKREGGASSLVSKDWEAARRDYGRWMYSIGGQPSALALVQRCSDQMKTGMAAAGLRD
ncbi:hypothetical protein [Sphingomonas sp. Y38-1Y]|uniref:hypothetical protein n=1 Tax=Sphingomonas sp. Y38-1Y TaxID=3078265 RepID=UPI0028EC2545|nr:hypothetical protein [Sphingomonas sp. Y38-1Y]